MGPGFSRSNQLEKEPSALKGQKDNSPGQRPGQIERGRRKPERLRDNSPQYSFAGRLPPNYQGLPPYATGSGIESQKGIRFRAALQAASLSATYPQGVALGCYPVHPRRDGACSNLQTQGGGKPRALRGLRRLGAAEGGAKLERSSSAWLSLTPLSVS